MMPNCSWGVPFYTRISLKNSEIALFLRAFWALGDFATHGILLKDNSQYAQYVRGAWSRDQVQFRLLRWNFKTRSWLAAHRCFNRIACCMIWYFQSFSRKYSLHVVPALRFRNQVFGLELLYTDALPSSEQPQLVRNIFSILIISSN